MTEKEIDVASHYDRQNLYETIMARLVQSGIDPDKVTRKDLSAVDEFHVRGAAVSRELADYIPLEGKTLLDVGCGIGGPCRMLTDDYGCQTTGIDLNKEFVRTAIKLSELVSLSDRTQFIVGSALDLPFSNDSFDVVWTQHVQMNISDKKQFYTEISRVVKPGGHFLYYDIFRHGKGEPTYPVPWADTTDISFLFETNDFRELMDELGLVKLQSMDQTAAGIDFFNNLLEKLRGDNQPRLSLGLLMGDSGFNKLDNLLSALKGSVLCLESGAYVKPSE